MYVTKRNRCTFTRTAVRDKTHKSLAGSDVGLQGQIVNNVAELLPGFDTLQDRFRNLHSGCRRLPYTPCTATMSNERTGKGGR